MATVQAITLKFMTPSSREEGGLQQWSCKFHLSGTDIDNEADAETAALGLAEPMLQLITDTSYLSGWLHYPANSTVNDFQKEYEPTDHPGNQFGYTDYSHNVSQQAEVCALFRAPTKVNSKGRMGYLFKYVHGAQSSGTSQAAGQVISETAADLLSTYATGIDTANRIPVAPDGTVPSAAWFCHPYLVTRQLRRGSAPKA